ncbi:MAG: hypothetical protein JNK19_08075 [Tabrizicola sp.]|nr:hypothetical protein [Tabrizicola sp.]
MSADPSQFDLASILEPDESLIWQGRIGFTVASSTFTMFVLVVIASLVLWAVWGSYSLAEFCPAKDRVSRCGAFYIILPLAMIVIVLAQGFDWLERRAVESGKALGAVILTDRRLIRVSEWPWRRIRSHDYLQSAPDWGLPGVIRFGRTSIILATNDAKECMRIMEQERKAAS